MWRAGAGELKAIMGSWALERVLRPLAFTPSHRRGHCGVGQLEQRSDIISLTD